MASADAVRSLSKAIIGAHPSTEQVVKRIYTTVATVVAGASTDGLAAATVAINSDNVPAPYNANYTPHAGDRVAVDLVDGSPVIAFKVVGFPTI